MIAVTQRIRRRADPTRSWRRMWCMSSPHPGNVGASAKVRQLAERQVTAVQLVDEAIGRIEEVNSTTNAVAVRRFDEARPGADQAGVFAKLGAGGRRPDHEAPGLFTNTDRPGHLLQVDDDVRPHPSGAQLYQQVGSTGQRPGTCCRQTPAGLFRRGRCDIGKFRHRTSSPINPVGDIAGHPRRGRLSVCNGAGRCSPPNDAPYGWGRSSETTAASTLSAGVSTRPSTVRPRRGRIGGPRGSPRPPATGRDGRRRRRRSWGLRCGSRRRWP